MLKSYIGRNPFAKDTASIGQTGLERIVRFVDFTESSKKARTSPFSISEGEYVKPTRSPKENTLSNAAFSNNLR